MCLSVIDKCLTLKFDASHVIRRFLRLRISTSIFLDNDLSRHCCRNVIMNCISHLKVNFNSMRSYTRNSVSFIVVYLHTLRQLACNKYAVRFPIISESLVIKLNSTHVRRCLGNYDGCRHAGYRLVGRVSCKVGCYSPNSNLSLPISFITNRYTIRQLA